MTDARLVGPNDSRQQQRRDDLPLLLGIVTIVSGVALGLFADLRLPGKILGVAAFLLWAAVIACALWRPEVTTPIRVLTIVAFAVTAALVLVAVMTGPNLNDRTVVLSERGATIVNDACPGAVSGQRAAAGVALSQLQDQFVHVEFQQGRCAHADVRLRADDLLAVLPK